MGKLKKIAGRYENDPVKDAVNSTKKAIKAKKAEPGLPRYTMDGKVLAPEKKKKKQKLVLVLVIILAVACLIYVPQFLMEEETVGTGELTANSAVISQMSVVLRQGVSEDFDGDSLMNSEEDKQGTGIYNVDTDGDGATDYCELYVTKTSPLTFDDVLVDAVKAAETASGDSLGTPYKVNNVILWPSSYDSKAYGSVAETLNGYHFCKYSGYAQFSAYPGYYAYAYIDGIHSLLDYREDEDVWYIPGGTYVDLYPEMLEEYVQFGLFGLSFTADSNAVTDILAFILPDRGLITAVKLTEEDLAEGTSEKTVPIVMPEYDKEDYSRLKKDGRTMSDLAYVYQTIDKGACVLASFYSDKRGEALGIVYGYDSDGNLLVADSTTLQPEGVLQIAPMARNLMDKNGDIVIDNYFDFYGLGFSSASGHRINFFADSLK